MRDVNVRLSMLRELVYEQPSALDWEALRRLLSQWRDEHPESLGLGLDYASVRLGSWPAPWRRVECRDAPGLVTQAPEAVWPLVRQLLLYEIPAGRGVPQGLRGRLAGLSHLELWFKAPEPALARLWASGELGAMEGLVVRGGLEARGAQALGHAPMPRLMALDLDSNPLGAHGLDALAEGPLLSGLRHLRLGRAGLGDAGVPALLQGGALERLELLSLRMNGLGPEAIEALGGLDAPRLQTLELALNPLGDAGARALAALPMSPGLRRLDLRQCDIGLDGLQALSGAPWIESLERLTLGGNRIAPWHQVVLDRLAPTVEVVWE